MNRRKFLSDLVQASVLVPLVAGCTNNGTNNGSGANYFPGTIKGRSPPATQKHIKNLSEITQDDIGSYVLIETKNKSDTLYREDNEIIIYSSRMDATNKISSLQASPDLSFEALPIAQETYKKIKSGTYRLK